MLNIATDTGLGAPPRGALTKSQAKRWHVREMLRAMIVDGRLAPGSRLIQQDLASQLQTSVGVIRELLLELAAMGLVETEQNHGFVVSVFDLKRLTDTYLIRSVHEGLAARLCCQKVNRQDLRQLREMVAKIMSLHKRGEADERRQAAALDRQFHAELIRIADNEPLRRASCSHSVPVLVSKVAADRRSQRSNEQHTAIIDAIEEDRPDDAERLAREHVLDGLQYLREQFDAGALDMEWLA